jgi:Leucine-rich repeat (LRR) protein
VELRGVCEDASSFRRIVNSAETNVNLSWQKLASLDGATLAQLAKLKTLLLQFNKLTAVPDEIGTLTDLIELALYRNELETLPESLGSLVNLEKLWLNDNKASEKNQFFSFFFFLFLIVLFRFFRFSSSRRCRRPLAASRLSFRSACSTTISCSCRPTSAC